MRCHILSALLYFYFQKHRILADTLKHMRYSKCIIPSIMGLFMWHECLFTMYFNVMVMWLMIIKTLFSYSYSLISYLDLLYHSGYHFIKMLNRPVDFALRFIIVCVAEPLTLKKKNKKRTSVWSSHVTVMTFKPYYSQISKYTFNGRMFSLEWVSISFVTYPSGKSQMR